MKKLLSLFLVLMPLWVFTQDTLEYVTPDSWVKFAVQYDYWAPFESNFTFVTNENGDTVFYHQPTEIYQYLDTIIYINSGDYIVTLNDSYGDGWTGGEPSFKIMNACQGELLNFDLQTQQFFTLDTLVNIWPCAPPQEGCTNDMAINYNEEAFIDNGSCEFNEGCTDPLAENFDETAFIDDESCTYIYGCINEFASNYDSLAADIPTGIITPGSTCNLVSFTNTHFGIDPAFYLEWEDVLQIGARIYVGDNGQQWFIDAVAFDGGGCNSPTTLIYVVSTEAEADGNPNTNTPGVNVNAVVGEIWQVDPCIFIYGCTNPTALNFNPEAGVDDGSCINIPGCTDPSAASYNPAATQDDGSCNGGDVICTENKTLVTVEIMVDQYGCETSWIIYDQYGDGTPLAEVNDLYCGVPVGTTIEYQTCINDNTNIMFWLQDSYGDGLGGAQWGGIDGTWIVYTECGDTISEGIGDFGELIIDVGQVVPCAPEVVEGCTDDNYLEFNPYANTDNGSCETERVFGCINPDAFNYDENANTQLVNPQCLNTLRLTDWADNGWAGSFMVVTQGDDFWGPFTLESDQTVFETQINLNTEEMVKAYFYSFGQSQQTTEQCSFEILNPIGDIILEGGTNPYTNPILSYNQYNFLYQGQALCGNNCEPKIYGCLDSEAVNYDELANTTSNDCYYNPGCIDAAYIEYYNYIANNGIEADFDNGTCEVYAIFGCIDETAFNYNELATVNQVAVEDETDPCIPTILGCTDPLAFNYNSEANTLEPGSCEPVINGCTDSLAFNYDEDANTDNDSCIEVVEGCTDSTALNYNENANTDNNSCISYIYGCTDETAFNYDEDANTDNDSCIAVVEGCTNILSVNYNIDANTDDGSCVLIVYGCTDSTAFNYNEDANTDNDSCIAVVEGCTDPSALNYNSEANTEDFSCIAVVNGCTDSEAFNYDADANTDNGSCIPVVEGCTNVLAVNYNADANTDDGSCELIVYGCTDETASNYNEDANTDNDSCIPFIYGCTNPDALNYNELANTDDFSCVLPIYGCTNETALNYNESANVDNGSCIAIVEGCTDSTALNFNENANVENGSCIPFIYGCTDSTAFNYDSTANTDNGSCIEIVEGCTNTLAVNYNENANTDDGSCILIVYGCTDETALNYNPDANTDNDSCIEIVEGCTDPNAFNYNANANVEDFSCIEVIIGCTDENAINYDPLANTDSGSCIDVLTGCTDVSAYNYSLTANTDDGSCVYDAGCSGGPGEPYWLPNECFAWVISIDTECCSGEWDSYCVELYNYCDLGWPIDLEEISRELLIYPNPVIDMLNSTQEIDIKIYDMIGNLVISKEKANQIDMTSLSSGVYNLNIKYNNKIINNKIIKQ